LAGVGRHGFVRLESTSRTGQHRIEDDRRHDRSIEVS
jgi:hypothetical protein